MSNAALFPSMLLLPAIKLDGTEDSVPETSRPTGTMPCPDDLSALDPAIGPGPFCPKK